MVWMTGSTVGSKSWVRMRTRESEDVIGSGAGVVSAAVRTRVAGCVRVGRYAHRRRVDREHPGLGLLVVVADLRRRDGAVPAGVLVGQRLPARVHRRRYLDVVPVQEGHRGVQGFTGECVGHGALLSPP